ncbi:glycoside hydrolase family 5 protein [Paucibacter soli]|uniref:glycoside hydrolase family 5 protein n=1 Tax=Paucibacter soli TaxID=3133433 RepID=UPI00309C63C2
MTVSRLRVRADQFLDEHGRQIMLRGVCLGGDSKVPAPDGGTQYPSDFADHRTVSFVGRPFPLSEAAAHFTRLRAWGFNCLRLIVTWEAINHAGPGAHDQAYLSYIRALCQLAGQHGFYVIADMHQDAWSRMSGGSGAPGWVFEAVGLDFRCFDAADAAWVMQQRFDYSQTSDRQPGYPQMSWHLNYRLPANGLMWTLFWAGRSITPDFRIDGQNVQNYLQGHFLAAATALAGVLADLPQVIGFDLLNEPGLGWLGQPLSKRSRAGAMHAPRLSPLDALAMASGLPVDVPMEGAGPDGERQLRRLNKAGRSIWRSGARCPFEAAGVYRLHEGRAEAMDEQAFQRLSINDEVFAPFYAKASAQLRQCRADWLVLLQIDALSALTNHPLPARLPAQAVNASHWYDVSMLVSKRFDPHDSVDLLSGEHADSPAALRARHRRQLAAIQAASAQAGEQGLPTLIGEFGIPYDLDEGLAYRQWAAGAHDSAFAPHVQALELMYEALDELLLSATQWNYSAGNRNELRIGDQWNQEDLSIYSRDQAVAGDPLSGGRAVLGFARPYAAATQGRLLTQRFERTSGRFEISYSADPSIDAPTLLMLPAMQFPRGYELSIEGPARAAEPGQGHSLQVWALGAATVRIICQRKP